MARKSNNAYLGLPWIVCVILAIFPLTNIIGGIITRLERRKLIPLILNCIPFFWPFFWLIDLISMILNRDLEWFA
ncbi:MAG: hypothetical protein FWE38_01115 [Firmicutes bacterium]|nr:hypothetical protein [Bacillota bacterium]